MTRKGAADPGTRERLLDAATRLFASRGFRHVTVREICAEATANVAAVHYHFGDKMALYRAVIDAAAAMARESTALAMAAGEGQPPDIQLRRYIEVMHERMATAGASGPSYLQQIFHREMTAPTGAVTILVDRLLKGRFEYLQRVIAAYLDLTPGDPRVALAATSIHGLIVMYRPTPLGERVSRALNLRFTPDDVAAHLVRFAMAGLDSYRVVPPRARSRHAADRH